MKKLTFLGILLMVLTSISYGQRVSPNVDSVLVVAGDVARYVASWGGNLDFMPRSTSDTLVPPFPAQKVDIVPFGTSSDTVWACFSQMTVTGTTRIWTIRVLGTDAFSHDFGGAYIKRMYIKGSSATIKTLVVLYN